MKKFILIAYKFPPYSQVGGYRWAKLSKYLARLGHEIHVLTVDWDFLGHCDLVDDVTHKNIHIHKLPAMYPVKWRYSKNTHFNLLKKIFFKLAHMFIWFDDEAQYWHSKVIPYAKSLIESEDIETLVATGAPFHCNLIAAKIKEQTKVNLIQDFRDAWSKEPYSALRPKWQRKLAHKYEQFSIKIADRVVTVSNGLLSDFDGISPKQGVVITNGVDPEDINELDRNVEGGQVTLVHAGSLASGRFEILESLLKLLSQNQSLFNKVRIKLIGGDAGSIGQKIRSRYADLIERRQLILSGRVPRSEVLSELAKSDFALHLNGDNLPYALSTKIFEHIALRVPTLSLNCGGEVDSLIKEHNIGHSINIKNGLSAEKLEELLSANIQFDYGVDLFFHHSLAKSYSLIINSLKLWR